jgi:hypothetical protein
MTLRNTWLSLTLVALGCGGDAPIPPPDPKGKDLVEGVVVAAVTSAEATPGIRTYKVIHVDDYPEPVGFNLHMIAYDPKAPTFAEAARVRKKGGMKVVMGHLEVRLSDFLTRDHRVIAKESITDEERAPYIRARDFKAQ